MGEQEEQEEEGEEEQEERGINSRTAAGYRV